MAERGLDCIVIGYNEMPFAEYESLIRAYGEDSETYRDLKFSFVEADGRKMPYVELLNHVFRKAGAEPAGENGGFVSGEIPNLAAAYLTNFLRQRGHETDYINLFQEEKEKFRKWLEADPVCVAITTTFYVLNFPVNEMVQFVREVNPGVKLIVGGPLVGNHLRAYQGADLDAALKDIGADIYVSESQGEETLHQIVSTLKGGGDLGEIPNLLYLEDGEIHRTSVMPERNSLDENYIDWLDLAGGSSGLGATIQTRTARSCAFKCSFCNYPTRAGKLTLANLGTIEKELDSIRELGSVENVVFIDDTFNVPLPRFKDICRLMIEKNYGYNWFSYFRCSNADEEAIDLMAESGCKGVFLGIESGSEKILTNMNKRADLEDYEKGVHWLRERGILTFGSFIIGFPGETEETVDETIDFIRNNPFDYYRAQMWYCEHGTPIMQRREEFAIEGEGFVWEHSTMDSMEAMNSIERMFLTIKEAKWLPQWSFDFWIIPYLMGKGIGLELFKDLMDLSHQLLSLQIASVSDADRRRLSDRYMERMIHRVSRWRQAA